jgi:uncharacterized phage infection (PIP) family protein YhgE
MIDQNQWDSECDAALRTLKICNISVENGRRLIEGLGMPGQSAIDLTMMVLNVINEANHRDLVTKDQLAQLRDELTELRRELRAELAALRLSSAQRERSKKEIKHSFAWFPRF